MRMHARAPPPEPQPRTPLLTSHAPTHPVCAHARSCATRACAGASQAAARRDRTALGQRGADLPARGRISAASRAYLGQRGAELPARGRPRYGRDGAELAARGGERRAAPCGARERRRRRELAVRHLPRPAEGLRHPAVRPPVRAPEPSLTQSPQLPQCTQLSPSAFQRIRCAPLRSSCHCTGGPYTQVRVRRVHGQAPVEARPLALPDLPRGGRGGAQGLYVREGAALRLAQVRAFTRRLCTGQVEEVGGRWYSTSLD